MESGRSGEEGTSSRLDIQGVAGRVRLQGVADARGKAWDRALNLNLQAQASAEEGTALLAFLGLEPVITADRGPATLTLAAQGPLDGTLQANARLTGGGVAARADGTVQFTAEGPRLAAQIGVQAQDIGPALRALGLQSSGKVPATMTSRMEAASRTLQFDTLAGTLGGVPIHGRMVVRLDPSLRLEGRIAAESILASAVLAPLVGLSAKGGGNSGPGALSAEPFALGPLGKVDGRIEFELAQAQLVPGLIARNPRGVLRMGDGQLGLENLEAELAGGGLHADVTLRSTAEGLNAKGKLSLTNVDLPAFLPPADRPLINGRLSLQAEAQGAGRSATTLLGSLSGVGTVVLDGARLSHLDPKVFEGAMHAVDQGLAIETAKIRDAVAPVLDKGDLVIPRAQGNLTATSGQVRVINLVAKAEGIDLAVTGALDLADGTLDGRLTLTGPALNNGPRPDLFITISGPIASASRSIDASALANWLLLRSLDRDASRTDAAELEKHEPPGPDVKGGGGGTQANSPRRKPALDPAAPARPRRAAGDGAPPPAPAAPPPGGANPSILDRLFGSQR